MGWEVSHDLFARARRRQGAEEVAQKVRGRDCEPVLCKLASNKGSALRVSASVMLASHNCGVGPAHDGECTGAGCRQVVSVSELPMPERLRQMRRLTRLSAIPAHRLRLRLVRLPSEQSSGVAGLSLRLDLDGEGRDEQSEEQCTRENS